MLVSRLRVPSRLISLVAAVIYFAGSLFAQTDLITLTSPNGEIEFRLAMAYPPTDEVTLDFPSYQVDFHGQLLIDTSFIAFGLYSQVPLGGKLALTNETRASVDETYELTVGKTKLVRNHYNSVLAEYFQNGSQGRKLNIEVRAYDDGIAFRYIIPDTILTHDLRLESEMTQFNFAKDADAFPLILDGYQSSYEDQLQRATLSGIHPDSVVALPFLVSQPGVGWVAVTEANLDDYPGSYLWHEDGTIMTTDLSPALDGSDLVLHAETPVTTPWRVLLIGDTPSELIESNIITSLNPPSAIEDTSWIQPGKTLWPGWNGTQADGVDFEPGMDTATMNHFIDFAADAGLEYVLIDAGWAAEGQGTVADLTRTISAIDMPAILQHAASKDVGIWLSAHWSSVDSQMDEAFALFEQWGVKGVKIDSINRDDQWMVNWVREVAAKAAQHHLMLNFHGAFKPDGLRRTYPNVMTREAVLGLEYLKWSARVTPEHNVMLAFTRMLAGPMDYTPGGFNQVTRADFVPRNNRPMVLGTRAHQLALYVVFESPTMMVSDYPEAYIADPKDAADFAFVKAVPATWDETRGINGEVGEYITVARRSGDDWYLGSINDWHDRELQVPLSFLGSSDYIAEIYVDADDADVNPKSTVISRQVVSASDTLTLDLASGGGAAIRFSPVH